MAMIETIETDYLVIGGGSAGCVVAARLSETGDKILMLEAGPPDRNFWIHLPAGAIKLFNHPVLNWNYQTEPEPNAAGRSIYWPRGRVLGGSGSINGMNFVRGNPADYDGWAQRGARGWSYEDVLPYFKMIERRAEGDAHYRGRGGPVPVEDYRLKLPITALVVRAAQEQGHGFTPDLNGAAQDGAGYSQMNRTRVRKSSARTYLAEARKRPNLRVETDALATRLLFEGRRCIGVAFRQHGVERRITARREVVLSGGSINSPQLLQLSGIGPAEHLRTLGIDVLQDVPGIGANLIDHFQAQVVYRVKGLITTNEFTHGWRKYTEMLRWLATGRGAMTFGVTQVSIFVRSRPELASPDLQLLFAPISFEVAALRQPEKLPGMSISVCPGRPDSRGTILIKSADVQEKPVIRANYLSAATDRETIVAGIRIARRILNSAALTPYREHEIRPGIEKTSDDELLQFAREWGNSVYHPVGTCRMGEDAAAVVDSRLRLRGIEGLRVIDASVMPTLTTGNTNAPTMMIAEKGAAMIREDAR
jgi:choline dehydrogenase